MTDLHMVIEESIFGQCRNSRLKCDSKFEKKEIGPEREGKRESELEQKKAGRYEGLRKKASMKTRGVTC